MGQDLLKSHLSLMLLAVIGDGPAHGYSIINELHRKSEGAFDAAEGTIYPALHRLEKSGLIASRWLEEAGRRRRVYRITERGRKALTEQRDDWRGFYKAVNSVLKGA